MNHLIIYSHLNPESFTKAVVDEVVQAGTARGDKIEIIDLYAEGFNPVLSMPDIESVFMGKETPEDVQHYQEKITWADHLTVVYPIWWGQMPAILKGFVDRVFTSGYAFLYEAEGPVGLLKDKTAQVIINTGAPEEFYEPSGMHDAQRRVVDGGVFGFCGMDTKIEFFNNIVLGSDEDRKAHLAKVKNLFI